MIYGRTVTAIILIAGNSTRFGQNRNKNFEIINGKPIIVYSLEEFDKNKYIDNIIIATKKSRFSLDFFLINTILLLPHQSLIFLH